MWKSGIFMFLLVCAASCPADATPSHRAVDILVEMTRRVREVGCEQTVSDFAGSFASLADLNPVLFCVDADGNVTFSGARSAMVGRSIAQRSDVKGNDLHKVLRNIARHPGFGEITYRLRKMDDQKYFQQKTFVRRVSVNSYCGVDLLFKE